MSFFPNFKAIIAPEPGQEEPIKAQVPASPEISAIRTAVAANNNGGVTKLNAVNPNIINMTAAALSKPANSNEPKTDEPKVEVLTPEPVLEIVTDEPRLYNGEIAERKFLTLLLIELDSIIKLGKNLDEANKKRDSLRSQTEAEKQNLLEQISKANEIRDKLDELQEQQKSPELVSLMSDMQSKLKELHSSLQEDVSKIDAKESRVSNQSLIESGQKRLKVKNAIEAIGGQEVLKVSKEAVSKAERIARIEKARALGDRVKETLISTVNAAVVNAVSNNPEQMKNLLEEGSKNSIIAILQVIYSVPERNN